MPRRITTYFGLGTPAGRKTLFMVFELPDGTLCIDILAGLYVLDGSERERANTIHTQKFSIHPTKNNPEYCTITFQQSGRNVKQHEYTNSRKLNDGEQVHILSKRFSDFEDSRYDLKLGKEQTDFFEFKPYSECLVGHFFVSRRGDCAFGQSFGGFRWRYIHGRCFTIAIAFDAIAFPAIKSSFLHRILGKVDLSNIVDPVTNEFKGIVGSDHDIGGFISNLAVLNTRMKSQYFEEVARSFRQSKEISDLMWEIDRMVGSSFDSLYSFRDKASIAKRTELLALL